jgi:hypothetical protein
MRNGERAGCDAVIPQAVDARPFKARHLSVLYIFDGIGVGEDRSVAEEIGS